MRCCPKNRKKPNFEVFGKIFDPVIPGMMGVGSPLLYGVTLRLGRPFVTACLGGGFGGAFIMACVMGFVLTFFTVPAERVKDV